MYSTITTPGDCHQLQADLNTLEQWAKKFLRVTNKANPIHMSYYIQNEKIKEAHAKYLGVTIDQHLMWNEHIQQRLTMLRAFSSQT